MEKIDKDLLINQIKQSSVYNMLSNSRLFPFFLLLRQWAEIVLAPRYFSQTGEDVLVKAWLSESNGVYIDVGCGKPVTGSNTYSLYRKGWRGICIDPIERNSKLFKRIRKRDTFILGLIGLEDQELDFWEFESYVFSTCDSSEAIKVISTGKSKQKSQRKIKAIPLRNLVPHVDPLQPSFMSIDAEGWDLQVLESNDWEKFSPRVIAIEEHNFCDLMTSPIKLFLETRHYKWMGWSGLSSVYVNRKFIEKIQNEPEF